jgi:membrane associated rhomboid family serine protease
MISGFTDLFKLSENALPYIWQFLTAIFLHGSLSHLAYNLFALILFGLITERLIGSKRFLLLFFLSGILANIISWYWYPNALGASGAIMGVIGVAAAIKPLMIVWAFGMILPMFIVAILWIIGSILGIFGFGSQNIGYLAHLSGVLIGILYGLSLRLRSKRKKPGFIFQRKIKIPENIMRRWEYNYMHK